MEKNTLTHALLDWMASKKITTGFGVSGGAVALLHGLLEADKRFRLIMCQHEAGAAYMAGAYNILNKSGDWAFCFSTSGPGATNMITGVASAHAEKVPLLAISGNCSTENFGRGGLQDSSRLGLGLCSMMAPITVSAIDANRPDGVISALDKSWDQAVSQRKPVYLNYPINVSKMVVSDITRDRESETTGGIHDGTL